MSQQQTVMGYLGERSLKVSSIYADNYVISHVTSTGGLSADGAGLVVPATGAPGAGTTDEIIINSTSGFFTTAVVVAGGAGLLRMVVTNNTVGNGSQIALTVAPGPAGYDADFVDFDAIRVGLVADGSFEIAFVANAASADQDFTIGFTVLNPSA